MQITLTLDTLKEIDSGRISAAFNAELRRIAQDLIDRPADPTARTVVLTVTVKPNGDSGVCETADLEFRVKSSVPQRRSRSYSVAVQGNGSLVMNPVSPQDVRQRTLDEIPSDPKKE